MKSGVLITKTKRKCNLSTVQSVARNLREARDFPSAIGRNWSNEISALLQDMEIQSC
jgi:hypothetical protein